MYARSSNSKMLFDKNALYEKGFSMAIIENQSQFKNIFLHIRNYITCYENLSFF